MTFAYLSQGKLYVHNGETAVAWESPFAAEYVARSSQEMQRHAWKTQGRGARFMSGGSLWGVDPSAAGRIRIAFSTVASAGPGRLIYALEAEGMGGLFLRTLSDGAERRLLHRENFHLTDLSPRPADPIDEWAGVLRAANGTAHVVVIHGDGPKWEEVTEGDSVDESPAWVPGPGRRLVFQSAGVARNAEGYAVGLGPSHVVRLDLDTGGVETLREDPAYDFLNPRMTADGSLYVIRRPHEGGPPRPGLWGVLTDGVLFPVRLARAVLDFLDFFSHTFSKKPLLTSGGPKTEGENAGRWMLRGRLVDARLARAAQKDPDASLVPSSWELLRRTAAGAEEVLARGVASFDVAPSGELIYTNGATVFGGAPGAARRLHRAFPVEAVAWIQ